MSTGRCILLAGLPAGLGASTVALSLGEALHGLGRSVLMVTSLANISLSGKSNRPARWVGSALLLPQDLGPDLVPLDLVSEDALVSSLPLLAREADFLLLDRFTGLNIRQNPWFRAADEILMVVDGRTGQDTRSLLLLGHVHRHWPAATVLLMHNRMSGPFNWQTASQRFVRRSERQHGFQPVDLGCLPEAPEISRAGREGKPFVRMFPNHPGSRLMRTAARQLLHRTTEPVSLPAAESHNVPQRNWVTA